jgi:hypothetical protein
MSRVGLVSTLGISCRRSHARKHLRHTREDQALVGCRRVPLVDVFSEVIATVRTGRPKFALTRRIGSWGNRFGPYPGAGFHVLLHGSCWLIPPAGEPVPLHAGDVVFLPHGSLHGMSDSPDRRVNELPPEPANRPDENIDDPGTVRAHLLCGAYRLDRGQAHPFLRTLPDVVHLSASSHQGLRAAVDQLHAARRWGCRRRRSPASSLPWSDSHR